MPILRNPPLTRKKAFVRINEYLEFEGFRIGRDWLELPPAHKPYISTSLWSKGEVMYMVCVRQPSDIFGKPENQFILEIYSQINPGVVFM